MMPSMPGDITVSDVDEGSLADLIPRPHADANKYSRGTLTVVGGCMAYPGAVSLAAYAGQRMGAGYVRVFCSEEAAAALHTSHPSVVASAWDAFDIVSSSLGQVKEGHPEACLVGPGMCGESDIERRLLFSALRFCAHPLAVDGGAISYLATEAGLSAAQDRGGLSDSRESDGGIGALVLTPHFGEAVRLAKAAGLDIPDASVQTAADGGADDAILAAFAAGISEAYCATVMLKGPVTYICRYPASSGIASASLQPVYAMRFGTPALAKAGTGDVLAGMAASLLAQGLPSADACILASSLHALSAARAARSLSDVCVIAEDVICYLPEIIGNMVHPKDK